MLLRCCLATGGLTGFVIDLWSQYPVEWIISWWMTSGLNAIAFIVTWLWSQLIDIAIIIKMLRLEYMYIVCIYITVWWLLSSGLILALFLIFWYMVDVLYNLYYHYYVAAWMQYGLINILIIIYKLQWYDFTDGFAYLLILLYYCNSLH